MTTNAGKRMKIRFLVYEDEVGMWHWVSHSVHGVEEATSTPNHSKKSKRTAVASLQVFIDHIQGGHFTIEKE